MFSIKRLGRKSQSVDLPGFPLTDPTSSLVTTATDSVVTTTTKEHQSSSTNQRLRGGPRRGALQRGFTIDEGQKRDMKDGRWRTFQRPAGTVEYRVESRDTLNSIALKFDTTPNELVTLNKLFSRAVVPGKVLYVPDPDFVSNAESSPSMSPISPPSPSPSEPDLLQVCLPDAYSTFGLKTMLDSSCDHSDVLVQGAVGGVLLLTPTTIMFDPLGEQRGCDLQGEQRGRDLQGEQRGRDLQGEQRGRDLQGEQRGRDPRGREQFGIMAALEEVMSVAMCTEVTDPGVRGHLPDDVEDSGLQANESSSSAAASLSKDVFSESEVSLLQDNDVKPSQHAMGLPAYLGQRAAVVGFGQQGAGLEPQDQEAELEAGHVLVHLNWPTANQQAGAGQLTAREDSLANQEKREEETGSGEDTEEGGAGPGQGAGPGGEAGPSRRRAGFVVVKKKQEVEPGSERPPVHDITSKDWEVVSAAEYQRRVDALHSADLQALCRRLQISTRPGAAARSDLESEPLSPTLSEPSRLLTPERILQLVKHLPPRTIGYPWTLAFSTANHGSSIKTLYRNMAGLDTPTLMVLKDGDGQVFGALASEPLRVSDCFYGTGETFLFSFCPELQVFKWTGDNMFFLKGDTDSLTFGGGGGFGLWLDGDLYHGRSSTCGTFGNPRLTQREDFVLQDIEVWAFH
ncbi:oxidation resistance protein 1-like [Myripristis murdjan]|uniref:oxidation resistance protein 1-like n=1 Tax=Myripristis murdjan TaxID=586833 RepID=UPI001175F116|nr:oxidation resistance protein 1-like [Myripristis murdjan]